MEMLLTVEQAAERLQLHPETVRRQLQRGELRAIKRGRVWRVPESALGEATPATSHAQSTPQASDETATVEAIRTRLQTPLDPLERRARASAALELDALFEQLNAENRETLSTSGASDFAELVAAGYDERETEQL